jgi:TPR repeat protein
MLMRTVLTTLLLVWAYCTVADFKAGGDAYNRGDYKTAAAEFLPLAEKGDHRAMYALGSMYAAGHGVPQDFKLAMKWFQAAARYGRPDAEYKIGLMYLEGVGTERNPRRAINWFGKSAEQGYADAQYQIGKMYVDGNDVKQDNVQAASWLILATANGQADAKALLAAIAPKLTPEQLQEAKRLSETHQPKFNNPQQ